MNNKQTYIETDWELEGGKFAEVKITYYRNVAGEVSIDSVIDTKTGEQYDIDDVDYSELP